MSEYALLIDTTAIQSYVFGSNKLAENLGASALLKDTLEVILKREYEGFPKEKKHVKAEIYSGGGNAILFFESEEYAKEFITLFSTALLVEAPGISTAYAIGEYSCDDDKTFKANNDALFALLAKNKNKFHAQTTLPRHGFTAECRRSGLSMEASFESEKDKDIHYVSAVSAAKNSYAKSKAAKDHPFDPEKDLKPENIGSLPLRILTDALFQKKYTYTNSFEDLGQEEGNNHIAIVHIDGNDMGVLFQGVASYNELKELSKTVKQNVIRAYVSMLERGIETIEKNDSITLRTNKDGYKILPIRPIIIGGDDITFVSDARCGILFTKLFMEEFFKLMNPYSVVTGNSNIPPVTSCAGIAITKTSYPFSRGYKLAEELCSSAKKRRRSLEDTGSWLDFHIAFSGLFGNLEEIRKEYSGSEKNLLLRPYRLESASPKKDELAVFSFETFLENSKTLLGKTHDGRKAFPRSKLKEFREVLSLDELSRKAFLTDLKFRNRKLPMYTSKKFDENCFDTVQTASNGENREQSVTPYFDMLEIHEFYPFPNTSPINNADGGTK